MKRRKKWKRTRRRGERGREIQGERTDGGRRGPGLAAPPQRGAGEQKVTGCEREKPKETATSGAGGLLAGIKKRKKEVTPNRFHGGCLVRYGGAAPGNKSKTQATLAPW